MSPVLKTDDLVSILFDQVLLGTAVTLIVFHFLNYLTISVQQILTYKFLQFPKIKYFLLTKIKCENKKNVFLCPFFLSKALSLKYNLFVCSVLILMREVKDTCNSVCIIGLSLSGMHAV